MEHNLMDALEYDPSYFVLREEDSIIPGLREICFPDGQVHFEVSNVHGLQFPEHVHIECRLGSPDQIFRLLALSDCLSRNGVSSASLTVWHMMGQRMDRSINGGTLTIKVVADLINDMSLYLDEVNIFDPHSDVTLALIDRAKPISAAFLVEIHIARLNDELLKISPRAEKLYPADFRLVAPDAGAAKRVEAISKKLGIRWIQGMKHRDTHTGKLTGFSLAEPLTCDSDIDPTLIIVDDLCDGGGTFEGLGQWIIDNYGVTPHLVVSHGIFSHPTKGMNLDNISYITTTNSVRHRRESTIPSHVNIVKVI